jgi:putative lipoprotein
MGWPLRLGPGLLALGLAACATPGGPARLEGSVSYLERVALPPDAVVNVMLLDLSLVGVPQRVVAKQEIRPAGQVPIPFVLEYDRAAIDPAHRYGLRAKIFDARGRLLWINIVLVPVFRDGAPEKPTVYLQRAHARPGP